MAASTIEHLESFGAVVQTFDAKSRWSAMQRWRTTFARSVKNATGHGTYKGVDWHAFSWNFSPAKSRHQARRAYLSESATELLVIPQSDTHAAVLSRGVPAPDFTVLQTDVYVFPEDLSWTMCFTHEDDSGAGPWFSRAEWCD